MNARSDDIRSGAEVWNKGPELIDEEGEVRELTSEDFERMRPLISLPADLQLILLEIQRGNVTLCPDEEKVAMPLAR